MVIDRAHKTCIYGADKFGIERIDKPGIDRAKKPVIGNENKLGTGGAKKLSKSGVNKADKQLTIRQTVIQAFIFYFFKVFSVFFSFSELKTYGLMSYSSSSLFSSLITSIMGDSLFSK